MKKRNLFFFGSLAVLLIALMLLFTGSAWLEKAFIEDPYLPFGTLTTWFGMIAVPLAVYWSSNAFRQPGASLDRKLSIALKAVLFLAFLWAPICYLLAGNLAYNFSEVDRFQGGQTAMRWFWRYSYGIPIASIAILAVYWIAVLVRRVSRNS